MNTHEIKEGMYVVPSGQLSRRTHLKLCIVGASMNERQSIIYGLTIAGKEAEALTQVAFNKDLKPFWLQDGDLIQHKNGGSVTVTKIRLGVDDQVLIFAGKDFNTVIREEAFNTNWQLAK